MTQRKPRRSRDDFRQRTVDALAKRVAYLCSSPACRIQTVGPAQGDDGHVTVGVAAHITAAAPGGPRYDPLLTPEQRRHQSNGIWLCEIHAKQIDADDAHFTVQILNTWKQGAESKALNAITRLRTAREVTKVVSPADDEDLEFAQKLGLPAEDNIQAVTKRVLAAAKSDLVAFKRMPGWPEHAIILDLTLVDSKNSRAFDVSRLASAMETFNEITVIAVPGTGKTTTVLQLSDNLLASGESLAAYIPLSEWALQTDSFLQSLTRRTAFQNVREQHFMLLAHHGRLVLVLDGWNEIDEQSRRRAANDIKSLQRDFPDIRIVVSTRQQALDVPISGPVVKIHGLSERQQVELARAVRGAEGEAVLDHAWRTPGLRELVAIPLYLTSLVSRTSGGTLPTTKEEVLHMFVEEHERTGPRAETLRDKLFGLHKEILTALALEATRTGNTTIPESRARAIVKQTEDRLSAEGQMAESPQPAVVLDILVNLHMLVRSGDNAGTLSFQHQQFQEWYASFEVETLMRATFAGDVKASRQLREDVLDIPAWEEAILFACERTSRADSTGIKAVSTTVLETMEIDPLLAAEMIYRSAGAVWDAIGQSIVSFVEKWHTPGKVDRAVHFMIGSGREEFSQEVWRLISDADTQVHLRALRAGRQFRPSVLGTDVDKRIVALPEEVRKHVLSEIAGESGMDGIELATKFACADSSTKVKAAVIESLQFRQADRFVTQVLRTAPDEVWHYLASKGYADEIADQSAAERLRKEQQRAFEVETSPLRKVQILTDVAGAGAAASSREIATLIEGADFPARDQNAGWAVDEAFKRYPDEISSALVHRLEAGMEIPFRAEGLLKAKGLSIDDGPLITLVMEPGERERVAGTAVCIVGPKTIGRLFDRLVAIDEQPRASEGHRDEALGREYHRLSDWISNAGLKPFAEALLNRSDTNDSNRIALLADLLARHGRGELEPTLRMDGELHKRMVTAVGRWADSLLSSGDANRTQLANIARAIERLAAPSLVPTLQRLLGEDLVRWKRAREEFIAARGAGRRTDSDAQMSWTLQYRRAFAAIGGEQVEKLMQAYLPDAGFCGFGVDAACVLKAMWDREQNSPKDKRFISWPDFSEVNTRRIARQKPVGGRESSPFADTILAVVNDLAKPDAGGDAHRHALALANIAFSMPYGDKAALIDTLLHLPMPLLAKQGLLTVLVLAGETISADLILAGIKELLEEAKTKSWLLDENQGGLEGWLDLLPFSDRPSVTFEAIVSLDSSLRVPWRLRRMLSALGHAPSAEAEKVLEQLARHDARFLAEYEWLNALDNRDTASAGRILFGLIRNGAFAAAGRTDTTTLSKKLARCIQSHEDLRREIYEQYVALPRGRDKAIVERAISEAADIKAIMMLVKSYAAQKKPFDGTLYESLRHVLIEERPSPRWGGIQELFGIPTPELRQKLFGLVSEDSAVSDLAVACLNAIDDIREHYGEAESEPRHPDIKTGRPWPIITGWRKT